MYEEERLPSHMVKNLVLVEGLDLVGSGKGNLKLLLIAIRGCQMCKLLNAW